MTPNDLKYLKANGWSECQSPYEHLRMFYKQFDTPTRCRVNEDKPGIQVEVAVKSNGCDIGIHGGMNDKDRTWIKIVNTGFMSVRRAVKLIPRLVKTWEYVNRVKG